MMERWVLLTALLIASAASYGQPVSVFQDGFEGTSGLLNAPGLPQGVGYTLYDASRFLYTGPDPIQTGMDPALIQPDKVAVIRGRILGRDGGPRSGVIVKIRSAAEFGETRSRGDGWFDLVVNGGGPMTVSFSGEGVLPLQRSIEVPWDEYVVLDDCVVTPLASKVDTIDLASNTEMQVAEGPVSEDGAGQRKPALLFPAGVAAEMVMPDGSRSPLNEINVRATEYTVGPTGPAAMPGSLPSTSAYTYAVELSVDEAMAEGARTVAFDQPIPLYVENYIGVPVGAAVPVAYYDSDRSAWVAEPDGLALEILATDNGLATLDLDGDGLADDDSSLADLGITPTEREYLAGKYQPGQTLWRVAIDHFTPFDLNHPDLPDLPSPPPPDPGGGGLGRSARPENRKIDNPCEDQGSVIECENRVLGKQVAVQGTEFSLNYRSDRVLGRNEGQLMEINLGNSINPLLSRISLRIEVAGQVFERDFDPPGGTFVYEWDGLDAYGRSVDGTVEALVEISYFNRVSYCTRRFVNGRPSFGRLFFTDECMATDPSLNVAELATTNRRRIRLRARDYRTLGLGGWTLNQHHRFDTATQTLFYGDGREDSTPTVDSGIVVTIAGGGDQSGEEVPALDADLRTNGARISGLATAPDGRIYFSLDQQQVVRVVDTDGLIRTIAGSPGVAGFSGDGGPAISALLSDPGALSLAPDGDLLVVDRGNGRIRAIERDGSIRTVAGGGSDVPVDEGIALATDLSGINELAVRSDGAFFVTILENPPSRFGSTWSIETDGRLSDLDDSSEFLQLDDSGRLLLAQSDSVRYLLPAGKLNVIFGSFDVFTAARKGNFLDNTLVRSLVVNPEGELLFSNNNRCITLIASPAKQGPVDLSDGFATRLYAGPRLTLAGYDNNAFNCTNEQAGAGEPHTTNALQARFGGDLILDLMPDGDLLIADGLLGRIRLLTGRAGSGTSGDIVVADRDTPQIYQFDRQGRHLATLNVLTGETLYRFTYTEDGQLASVTDTFGLETTIERDAEGHPTTVVAPFGQRTSLTVDTEGYLASIANAAGNTQRIESDSLGLITRFTNANGHVTDYQFNGRGLLNGFAASDGYGLTYTQKTINNSTGRGREVTTTTALGAASVSRAIRDRDGNTVLTSIDRDGAETRTAEERDGSLETTFPSGTIDRSSIDTRLQLGAQVPANEVFVRQTPQGKSLMVVTDRVLAADPSDPLRLAALTDTRQIGERVQTVTFDAQTRTITSTSPVGRSEITVIDDLGRPISYQLADASSPVLTEFDALGRATRNTFGSRFVDFVYNDLGLLESQTNAAGSQRRYAYDAADRPISITSPEGRETRLSYDQNGNLTEVTMPGGQVHRMTYTEFDEMATYQAPSSGQLVQSFDIDRRRTSVTAPDGSAQEFALSPGGRTLSMGYPEADVTFQYQGNTKFMTQMTWELAGGARTNTTSMTFDGDLPTSIQIDGDMFTYRYDDAMRLAGVTINSQPELSRSHDDDDLVIAYGDYAVSRNNPGGAPDRYFDGTAEITFEFDGAQRIVRRTHTVAGNVIYDLTQSFDSVSGRLSEKTETVNGVEQTRSYQFNRDGELTTVTENAIQSEIYTYDFNANRTGANGLEATFDDADRLQSQGSRSYSYDVNGRLSQRDNVQFSYSSRGELLDVTLSGGQSIEYSYDGMGRQVARSDADGTTIYLYGDADNPFQLSASRNPGGLLTEYWYDEADLLIGLRQGTEVFYVASDPVGSPRVIVDSTGTLVRDISYDSFGRIVSDSNPAFPMVLGFAGGVADPATGLVRFGFRDYDPEIGRWTSADPLLFAGGQFNLYAYVNNNPLEFRDPTGMFCTGFSQYDKWGGGAKFCFIEGRWSLCADVGFGFGGGPFVDPFGNPTDSYADSRYVSGSVGLACGPVGLGFEVKLDRCGRAKKSFACRIGPIDLCNLRNSLASFVKRDDALFTVKNVKCKVEGAVKGGACIGTNTF
ncbi:MAG: RHS repeat-associated core domain-containing protein [Pseudomonadota bacterium]